jgi:hypothetical protein
MEWALVGHITFVSFLPSINHRMDTGQLTTGFGFHGMVIGRGIEWTLIILAVRKAAGYLSTRWSERQKLLTAGAVCSQLSSQNRAAVCLQGI